MNRQPSLRRRLLLAGGIGLLLVSLLASALLGELFKRSARDRFDHELQQDMLTLLAQAEVDADGQLRLRQEPNDARFQRVFSGAYWQIAGADGHVLLQSRSLWDETLPAPAAGPSTRNLAGPLQQSLRARVQQVRLPRASEPFVAVVATDRSALDADVAAFRKRTVIALGVLIAPLPGPGGIPVIALGLVLVLRNSWWAKRQFIRAQRARPKWVYPFRRLMRKKPEIAPVFWQQALRAEKVVLRRRPSRQLIRFRKRARRTFRKVFRQA